MFRTIDRRLIIYSSILITILLNTPKLGILWDFSIVNKLWKSDVKEIFFQIPYQFIYCLIVFYIDTTILNKKISIQSKTAYLLLINSMALVVFGAIGVILHKSLFLFGMPYKLLVGGYFLRFFFTNVIAFITIRIWEILQTSKEKELENERLKNQISIAEVSLLKQQLNPHFLFNTLSSLSAVVREDAFKAQKYISHLSKVYRYTLQQPLDNVVSVEEELKTTKSYIELLKLRHEDGFTITYNIPESLMNKRMLHLSLQPLIENALKHNIVSTDTPLHITITAGEEALIISNNLQELKTDVISTGIGLSNLNERYRLLVQKSITICNNGNQFIVELPLS